VALSVRPAAARRAPAAIVLAVALAASASSGAVTLEEAVRQALTSDPDALIDLEERRARDEALKQARAGYLPNLDLRAAYGREYSDNPATRAFKDRDAYLTRQEGEVSVRQMLFDGFATRSEVERQRSRVDSSAYQVQSAQESTALRATEVYLDVLRQRELARLAQENLETHERIHGLIARRTESGLARTADLDQSESRVALARSNVVVENANLLDAETRYQRVVGALPDEQMQRATVAQGLLPPSLDDATTQAVASHPTLRSAEADVKAAMAQHEAAKHAFYPRFDLELGRRWNDNLDGIEGYDNDGQVMVSMRYNLYRGGADQARLAETAHLVNEAKQIRDRAHLQVVESIRLSWNAVEANDQRLKPLRRHLQASEATRNAYRKQFDLGERTLLDLLDSENELFEARRATTNTEYDSLFARYRVLAGMARLLASFGIEPPVESKPLDQE
jgi:adhesin transport system outer membrane protein